MHLQPPRAYLQISQVSVRDTSESVKFDLSCTVSVIIVNGIIAYIHIRYKNHTITHMVVPYVYGMKHAYGTDKNTTYFTG